MKCQKCWNPGPLSPSSLGEELSEKGRYLAMGNLRILIVEDDPVSLALMEKRLKKADYDIVTAIDGDEALERASESHFDVVLTDLLMPGEVDGIGVLEKIKAMRSDVDVILITAYLSVEAAVEAMKKGATDFLTKPINFDELIMRLEKIDTMKSLARAAMDLRDAMEATEESASQTIQDLELAVAEMKNKLSEIRGVLLDEDTYSQDRIERALNLLEPTAS